MEAYLGLGSNLGDRWANLSLGVAGLAALDPGLCLSPVFETDPVGGPPQGPYLNCVVRAEVSLEPRALLHACMEIERAAGRVRTERFGPRTLDLDIVYVSGVTISEPDLVVPHPRFRERAFVLVPLAAVAPSLAAGPLAQLDRSGVRLVGELVRSPAVRAAVARNRQAADEAL